MRTPIGLTVQRPGGVQSAVQGDAHRAAEHGSDAAGSLDKCLSTVIEGSCWTPASLNACRGTHATGELLALCLSILAIATFS